MWVQGGTEARSLHYQLTRRGVEIGVATGLDDVAIGRKAFDSDGPSDRHAALGPLSERSLRISNGGYAIQERLILLVGLVRRSGLLRPRRHIATSFTVSAGRRLATTNLGADRHRHSKDNCGYGQSKILHHGRMKADIEPMVNQDRCRRSSCCQYPSSGIGGCDPVGSSFTGSTLGSFTFLPRFIQGRTPVPRRADDVLNGTLSAGQRPCSIHRCSNLSRSDRRHKQLRKCPVHRMTVDYPSPYPAKCRR